MKKLILSLMLLTNGLTCVVCNAAINPDTQPPKPRYHYAQTHYTASPQKTWHPTAVFTFSEGSLKQNIEHVAKQFGWQRIVWKPQKDYEWVGQTKVSASSLTELLTKILENYPLQAVFYEGNHVLVITPRNLR